MLHPRTRAIRAAPPRFALASLLTLMLTLALALPAASASAAPLGGVNIDGLGYRSQPAEADAEIALARELHARVVRMELPWSIVEPRGPGQIDARAIAYLDRVMSDAAAANITVVAMVLGTPCWASSAPAAVLARCSPTSYSQASAWPPRDARAYAAFTASLAARYGTRLAAIEVWNEPDQANEHFLAGREKPRRYAELLRAAYTAVKAVNPGIAVLGGSLVGSNGVFLRALYRAGIKGYYDGLAVHFYNLTLGSVRSIREVQMANGDSKPLWLDEFGWSSCWPRHVEFEQACVTAALQAQDIRDVTRALAGVPYLAAEMLYKLRDAPGEEFGVVTAAGRHKQAFAALAEALAQRGGRVSAVRLRLSVHGSSVVASGTAPVGDFMGLEAFQGGVLRYRALFILDRFNRFSIRLPAVLGRHGLRVRVFQYWTGAADAAQRSI